MWAHGSGSGSRGSTRLTRPWHVKYFPGTTDDVGYQVRHPWRLDPH
jgi:hypothetical protein